jgi:hypothetical protein
MVDRENGAPTLLEQARCVGGVVRNSA